MSTGSPPRFPNFHRLTNKAARPGSGDHGDNPKSRSAFSFALFWFLIPLAILILMGFLGRSR